ncbi:hypothetical protein A2276_05600 [candidate division WOR-1 bacterium RIFOXYA12_FULL_43_27]|uniref:Uncharacterized protein n=1 Tax=candidate division WOR-1 bacterium RIFOXYC2_FULL_46_14 TaxID=1802587 RepID=A0A1F4U3I8_UNCSA|nr:MAG: hypothetical protein A2276_05600 [candidate division WOR-1 bacterium RIFOXYA12_FULL_43_27]OGC20140.1 MAG: hypothetical protein A2292_03605 [candidate division WOR-1 bacterium RIFOXYB2_FULL_46_45]OGC32123.1 MAG: hypothetical protein A2232_07845 [candidate division WOR-1 bacterium RIFOXYA2_FULL_46_56]OGC39524.1 MAG: hypothetical protein A2438_08210 [candidate division WOR-1 bacterium RIFOXYC2_FULL_46_14]
MIGMGIPIKSISLTPGTYGHFSLHEVKQAQQIVKKSLPHELVGPKENPKNDFFTNFIANYKIEGEGLK